MLGLKTDHLIDSILSWPPGLPFCFVFTPRGTPAVVMAFERLKQLGRRLRLQFGRWAGSNSPAVARSPNINAVDNSVITTPTCSTNIDAIENSADTVLIDTAPADTMTNATAVPEDAVLAAAVMSPAESLWNQAHDNLKETEEGLMQAYEKILSLVIRGNVIISPQDESEDNNIERQNVHARHDQMRQLVHAGLKQTARRARTQKSLHKALQVILTLKDTTSEGLRAAPEAALPYAGRLRCPASEPTRYLV